MRQTIATLFRTLALTTNPLSRQYPSKSPLDGQNDFETGLHSYSRNSDLTCLGCSSVMIILPTAFVLYTIADEDLHPTPPDKVDFVQGARSLDPKNVSALLISPKIVTDDDTDQNGDATGDQTVDLTITNNSKSGLTDINASATYVFKNLGTTVTQEYWFKAKVPIRPGTTGTLEADANDPNIGNEPTSPPTVHIESAHIQ